MPRFRPMMLALLLAGGGSAALVAQRLPPVVARVAADPARAADRAADARRHGPEILALTGIRPGDKVIDLIPGAGYWTRLFARAVGSRGHVYGIWPAPYAAEARTNIVDYRRLAATPAFANVSVAIQPATALAAPEKVDLVFTSQNYHDYPDKFMGSIDPAVFNRAVFAALKPGGTFLIIDHAAARGSGMRDTDTLHRIDPAIVRRQVTAAGFRFVGASGLLANPADDHAKPVFDRAIRGHTDQLILKFRKPG